MKNPDVYFVGCPCNMAHNATRKGSDSFSGSSVSSGFNVEDLVVDLDFNYYWIDKGTKRKNKLSFAYFVTQHILQVLKHVSTR